MKYTVKREVILGLECWKVVLLNKQNVVLDHGTLLSEELAPTWARNAARKYRKSVANLEETL